jgi:hypothetical protein
VTTQSLLPPKQQALDNDDPLNVPLMAALGPQAFTSVELKALALAEYGDPSVLGASGSPSNALTPYAGGGSDGSNSKGTSAQEAAERRAQVACTSDNMEALEVSAAATTIQCYGLVLVYVCSVLAGCVQCCVHKLLLNAECFSAASDRVADTTAS